MSETISPDTTIAQYRVISKIGEGGMGEVYRARDTLKDWRGRIGLRTSEGMNRKWQ